MKMKKNTRFNLKPDLVFDFIVIAVSLLIFFTDIYILIRELNKTFEGSGEPIAIVNYKYKTVQRKFLNRAVWDRPLQNSFLYNGDTIRTAQYAEAEIRFLNDDEAGKIDVGSNTMLQIFLKAGTTELNLNTGSVSSTSSNDNLVLKSDNSEIKPGKDSVLHIAKSGDNVLQVAVEKGNASFKKQDAAENIQETLKEGAVLKDKDTLKLVMISPANNARILNQSSDKDGFPVKFKWESFFEQDESLIFETASTANFDTNLTAYDVSGLDSLELKAQNGFVYWRLYPQKEGAESYAMISGKINVLPAPPPQILLPKLEEEFTYNLTLPSIRFLWEGNKFSSSYFLEIADNREMLNPVFTKTIEAESVNLSVLSEGSWYWRVKPKYGSSLNAESSKVSVFHIKKTTDSEKPVLKLDKDVFDTAMGVPLKFSWKPASDAEKYKVSVSSNKDMTQPIISKVVNTSYIELTDASVQLAKGEYYIQISSLDKNNEIISSSDVKSFKTLDDRVIIKSVFPPENYNLAQSLSAEARFTWKTNIDKEMQFQVSKSKDFKTFIINKTVHGLGIEGISLPEGECYWRLVMEENDTVFYSDIKKLNILPPLDKPELIDKKNNVVILPDRKNKFAWIPVKGADYYQIKISNADSDSLPIYENLFARQTDVEIDMRSLNNGLYVLTVQALSSPTIEASRRYGLTQRHYFEAKHLKPIDLLDPKNGTKISGLDAALNPLTARWQADQIPIEPEFLLFKEGLREPILNIKNADYNVKLPPLGAGTYRWKVNSFTEGGFDISARAYAYFTVLPIPPLPKAKFVFPENKHVLDMNYFKANRTIRFKWKAVSTATDYKIRIYDTKNNLVLSKVLTGENYSGEVTFELTNLSILYRGSFFIEVIAERRFEGSSVLQSGLASRVQFDIALPKTNAIQTDETGVLYGK